MKSEKHKQIYNLLSKKATLKQKIFDNTLAAFKIFKLVMQQIEKQFNEELIEHDQRILLRYKNAGIFQAELKVAGDLLIFNMHTNIFQFPKEHRAWHLQYLKTDYFASYVGIISIYNFLADSFKYNRTEDLGYLIARVFINKDNNYFVEGKKQTAYLSSDFQSRRITEFAIRDIIESAILYSLNFDLLVPHYEDVKMVTVEQILDVRKAGVPTGKRMGFGFNTDDIDLEKGKIIYSGG